MATSERIYQVTKANLLLSSEAADGNHVLGAKMTGFDAFTFTYSKLNFQKRMISNHFPYKQEESCTDQDIAIYLQMSATDRNVQFKIR